MLRRSHARFVTWLQLVALGGLGASACGDGGSGATTEAPAAGGGSATGGSAVGGARSGGTGSGGGGSGSGGMPTGGAASGGLGTGGATGGSATGGNGLGGAASGGVGTGGTATGGSGLGGATTGGSGLGGATTGGAGAGGSPSGGSAPGGASTGGSDSGGANAGGGDSGGASTGGADTGGASTGGADAGGAGAGGAGTGGTVVLPDVTVYIAGDSTVSTYTDTASPNDQAGWGQMLHEIFTDAVTVENRAAGGRTALWFYLEGATAWVLDRIQPEDYFFIQFGTNDGNQTATFTVNGVTYDRYADPQTDFKTYLKDYYLDPTRALGATPVLVTPPPRNSAYCGTGNSLGGYAQAMRELGAAEGVPVLDLNTKTFDYLSAICPSPTPEDFFLLRSDGTVDGTHFQENGARHMVAFLGECITEIHLGLEPYLAP